MAHCWGLRKHRGTLTSMGQLEWQAETVKRVADEMNKLRGNRSAQWLSDRTADLGFRVARSTISDLETGRRTRLDIAELLIIAAALNVPPVMLLYPRIPDGEIQVTPGISTRSIDAARWHSGETVLDGTDEAGRLTLRTSGGLDLMRLARERSNAGGLLLKALQAIEAEGGDLAPSSRQLLDAASEKLSELDRRIQELGGYIANGESDGNGE